MLNVFFFSDFYGFYVLLVNIYIYVLLFFLMFFLIFSFNVSNFVTLNTLSFLNNFNFVFVSLLCLLLSLAGIPPFLGFLGKFLIATKLLKSFNLFYFVLFLGFNFFVIYFYIQNFKFLTNYFAFFFFNRKFFLINLNYVNYFLIVFLNFLNFFSFFFFNDLFYFFLALFL